MPNKKQKQQTLEILKRLENFRKRVENGEVSGSDDWIIRMCQAKVAQDHFNDRAEWSRQIGEDI